ncbi:PAS domain S-box protein [Aureimonas sp. ME7]|uniref:helix-turn-helix transcriptional regulator n=1 Tax=Aureimonas sp. ME7 TaxID=2744252 RepID=UPI0015FCB1E7|nr:PAS domain S-box protein [Aureimonas sp. ME7]
MTGPSLRIDNGDRLLHQLIAGLRDGVILLDLSGRIRWANDAVMTMYGARRIEDLGCDLDDYRRRFRLAYRNKHPLSDAALSVEGAARQPRAERIVVEVHLEGQGDDTRTHALRFQRIEVNGDAEDFVVLVVEDETARYDAEDRFESAFNANPAPALICRVADRRFVRVNRGFLDMTGFSQDDVIGRTTDEFDVLAGSRGRDTALERLQEGRTIPQTEADLTLPDGSTKCVIVAGQPIELSDEPCILFTFADLEPRRRAEKALRQSEERFSKAFKLSPVAFAISRLDGFRYVEVNAAFEELTGYGPERLIGRAAPDLDLWTDAGARTAFETRMTEVGSVRAFPLSLRRADGSVADCLLSAERIEIDDVACLLSVVSDVTELKRTEGELVEAIDAVMADTTWFSRKIVERLVMVRQGSDGPPSAELDALSERERAVLELICEGMTDAEIAGTLVISRHTVRNHLGSLYRKIRVGRRSAAVVWARERGLTGRKVTRTSKKGQK